MDILKILALRIDALPEGDYTHGLKAVSQHIKAAANHLERGQNSNDDTAFTDAIYRTNQAFEGSLKEAFRVLAGKDPARARPFDIEKYFEEQNVLRPRVLQQLTIYRQEWRNPSTHDYRLDFDEDEALLAIVTVSAFAIVLIDQIIEQVSFDRAKKSTPASPTPRPDISLLDRVLSLLEQFTEQFTKNYSDDGEIREAEIVGALGGFLSSAASDVNVQVEGRLVPDKRESADLLLKSEAEKLIVEVKIARRPNHAMIDRGIQQVSQYMVVSGISDAVLYLVYLPNNGNMKRSEYPPSGISGRIIVVSTEAVSPNDLTTEPTDVENGLPD